MCKCNERNKEFLNIKDIAIRYSKTYKLDIIICFGRNGFNFFEVGKVPAGYEIIETLRYENL